MDKATLAFCVLIQQRQRDKAIGIANDTQLLRGLSAYVLDASKVQTQAVVSQAVRATWLKAMIEECTALAGRLTEHITANIEDEDIRNEGVYVMTKLESYVNHLGEELEATLWEQS